MKKLFSLLLIIGFTISLSMAQTATPPKAKKETKSVAATTKAGVKLKKDGTPDKRFLSKSTVSPNGSPATAAISKTKAVSNAAGTKLKGDGTPDKRYKATNEKANTETRHAKSEAAAVKKQAPTATASSAKNYVPTTDKNLKGPNGEEILTGPRGGKYYINKNGNKTYIKR